MSKMKIELNLKVYPLEAILNACYLFIDRVYVFLDTNSKNTKIIVNLKAKKKLSLKKLEQLSSEFMNELLQCSLRYKISKNNKKIREYIVGRALYSTLSGASFPAADDDSADYKSDPLGIADSWKEDHAKVKDD